MTTPSQDSPSQAALDWSGVAWKFTTDIVEAITTMAEAAEVSFGVLASLTAMDTRATRVTSRSNF